MDSSSDDTPDEESCDEEEVRQRIEWLAKDIENELLPSTSKDKYVQCYKQFQEWLKKQKTNSLDENVFLVYFKELSLKYCPSTLWSKWSMLRSVLQVKNDINLNSYMRLKTFIKQKSRGFKSDQAATFEMSDIKRFINEADDEKYLCMKVMSIMGICCAMRCKELATLKPKDVVDENVDNNPRYPNQYFISVIDAKDASKTRNYTIREPFYTKIKQYINLRPSDSEHMNFFLKYRDGNVSRNNIGKNVLGSTPKKIAAWLKLPHVECYKGHSWRRSSGTSIASAGGSIMELKQQGGWTSDAVAQRYVDQCKGTQVKLFNMILNSDAALSSNNDTAKRAHPTSPQASTSADYYEQAAPKKIKLLDSTPGPQNEKSKKIVKKNKKLKRNSDNEKLIKELENERSLRKFEDGKVTNMMNSSNKPGAEKLEGGMDPSIVIWGKEDDEWWNELVKKSIFLETDKFAGSQQFTSQEPFLTDEMPDSMKGNISESPSALTDDEHNVIGSQCNSKNCNLSQKPKLFSEFRASSPPLIQQPQKKSSTLPDISLHQSKTWLPDGKGIKLEHCTINHFHIHYYVDKENIPPPSQL